MSHYVGLDFPKLRHISSNVSSINNYFIHEKKIPFIAFSISLRIVPFSVRLIASEYLYDESLHLLPRRRSNLLVIKNFRLIFLSYFWMGSFFSAVSKCALAASRRTFTVVLQYTSHGVLYQGRSETCSTYFSLLVYFSRTAHVLSAGLRFPAPAMRREHSWREHRFTRPLFK